MASSANTAGLSTPPSPERQAIKGLAVPGGGQEVSSKAGSSPEITMAGGSQEITVATSDKNEFTRPGGIGQEV